MGRVLLGIFVVFCLGSLARFTSWVLERSASEREVEFAIQRRTGQITEWDSAQSVLYVGDIPSSLKTIHFRVPSQDGREVSFAIVFLPREPSSSEPQVTIDQAIRDGAEAVLGYSDRALSEDKKFLKTVENLDWIFSLGQDLYQSNTDLRARYRLPVVFKDRYRSPVLVLGFKDPKDRYRYRGLWNKYGGLSAYAFQRD